MEPESGGEHVRDGAGEISQERRRLVIASAAAPLVASLHSGSAAAASSAFQCLGGDFSNKKFIENGNSINGDTAVRVEVPFFKVRSNKKKHVGNQLANNVYLIDGALWDQAGNDYAYSGENIDLLEVYYEETSAHVLVLIDMSSGCPVELGPWPKYQLVEDGGIGNALTQPCWTSVMESECIL